MDSEHLEAYLAGELDEAERRRVEHALRHDARLRASFTAQARIDAALKVLLGEGRLADGTSFAAGVLARLRSEGAGERRFAKSVLLEIVEERERRRPARWPDLVKTGVISAAASIGLLLLFQSIVFRGGEGTGDASPAKAYVAKVERSENLRWDPASLARIHEEGWLAPGILRIQSGSALIAFNSGATALVEGPAELSIETGNRMYLESGRLVADVPLPANGFTVNTPRLNAVDLGTRFGISVDGEGNSELHVMEGEVEVSRTSGNAAGTIVREGSAVRADNRTRNELMPVPYGGDRFRLVVGKPAEVPPALCYRFDESVGAMIEDDGKDRLFDAPLVAPGELDQSPRRAAGRAGGGLVFRPGERLDVPLSREFRLDEAHSLCFWIKLPAKIGRTEPERLVEYGRGEEGWRLACNFEPDRGARGALRLECGGGVIVGSSDLADGNWHHVAYRYLGGASDLASEVHLFVDGKPETISHAESAPLPAGRVGNLRLGGDPSDGFSGWIDEFHIYREAVATNSLQELAKWALVARAEPL